MNTYHLKELLIIGCLLFCVTLSSCYCDLKDEYSLENSFDIGFFLLEIQTEYSLLDSYFHPDSVKVTNENGDSILVRRDLERLYFMPFKNVGHLKAIEKDTTEYFYLYLVKNGIDIDTFKVDYRVSLTDCSEKRFTYLNVFHNDKLVFEAYKDYFPVNINIYK